MAFPHRVCRYTMSGTMFNDQEIWSTGFYMGTEDADSADPDQASVDAVAQHWATWFTQSSSKVSGAYKTLFVKGALLNNDGKTMLQNVVQHDYSPAINGAYNGGTNPPQIALVVSLRNTERRGLGVKGRMYLPGIGQPIQPDGKIIGVAADEMATNFQTFVNAINADFAIPGRMVMASKGGSGLFPAPGRVKEVHEIKIGNVYDTQRRRRNALVESYSTRSITA